MMLQVKKTTFSNLPLDKAYGVVMPPDAEGAKAGKHCQQQGEPP